MGGLSIKLDQEDEETLTHLLLKMYPEQEKLLEKYPPNVHTLKAYLNAVEGNSFCNKAMTALLTELATATVGHVYRGKYKKSVKKLLKELKKYYGEHNLQFMLCSAAAKLKNKSPIFQTLASH